MTSRPAAQTHGDTGQQAGQCDWCRRSGDPGETKAFDQADADHGSGQKHDHQGAALHQRDQDNAEREGEQGGEAQAERGLEGGGRLGQGGRIRWEARVW